MNLHNQTETEINNNLLFVYRHFELPKSIIDNLTSFSFFSKPYEGLRPQDLRRLKDMLIVETADMLQAPLFTAEALLRAHGNETNVMLLIIWVPFEAFQS